MNTERTFTLSPAAYLATFERVEKINARAAKKGFTGRIDLTAEKAERTYTTVSGLKATEVVYHVTVTGTPPRYEGWTFVAALDWDSEAGLIVRTAPGVETPVDRSTLRQGECDHCQLPRHRVHIYVVRNEDTGEELQVGSTCVKDFLGWDRAVVFYSVDELEEDITEFLGGAYFEPSWSVDTVLAASWAAIQVYGYIRAGDPGSTKETVLTILNPRTKYDREEAAKLAPYIEDSFDQAALIREFILSDDFSGSSDYVTNLKAIAAAEHCNARNVGFLASAPQAWARAQARDLKRKKERAEIVNEFVGTIGERITIEATIKYINYIEGFYGTTTLYTLVGSDGHLYKWFSSNHGLGDSTDGTIFTLKGTIKDHDEYNGLRSTVLTRCAVLDEREGNHDQ